MKARSRNRKEGAGASLEKKRRRQSKPVTPAEPGADPRLHEPGLATAAEVGPASLDQTTASGEAAPYAIEAPPPHPLEGLSERAEKDPVAPFLPEVVEALAKLKKNDVSAYEKLIADLKANKKTRIPQLEQAIRAVEEGPGTHDRSATNKLFEIAKAADLFHTSDGKGYADIAVDGHRQTWPLKSRQFRQWLARTYYTAEKTAPPGENVSNVVEVLEGRANYDGPEREVFTRIAGMGDRVYIDMGGPTWRAVEIDASGWRIVAAPPVRFRRAPGMRALPEPQRGGSLDLLGGFLNLRSPNDFVLIGAWVANALRGRGPYPVLAIAGEQGAAKTTLCVLLRSLIDPASPPLRPIPRDERDLFIAATNSFVVGFDNLSGIPPWLSDALCRLATGGGFATRALFTDGDEAIFEARRPVLLNGIDDVVGRPDLADRAIFIRLNAIRDEDRRSESEITAAFEKACPLILGAHYNLLAHGLQRERSVRLSAPPRMADFATLGVAFEGLAWPEGMFLPAYEANRTGAVEEAVEADPIGQLLLTFVADFGTDGWRGEAAELLTKLREIVGDAAAKGSDWPKSARGLAGRLRRLAPALRRLGVEITFSRGGHDWRRTIILRRTQGYAKEPSAPSASRTNQALDAGGRGDNADGRANGADGRQVSANSEPSASSHWEQKPADGADGADVPSPSSPWETII